MAQLKVFNAIIGGTENSNIDKVCKALSMNMYMETQGKQASSPAILRSICGTSIAVNMPESRCRGMFRVSRGRESSPVLYTVFGSHVYLIKENGSTYSAYQIGSVSNGVVEPVAMCETNGYGDAHPRLIVADGAQLYAVDTTLTPAEQAADWKVIELPLRAGSQNEYIHPTHVAYLFGYLAVLDNGSDAFYLSCQYPFEEDIYGDDIFMLHDHTITNIVDGEPITSTITGNPYGFAVFSEWCPDSSRALVSAGSYLYTFGDRSFQCFSYHDDVNFPFQSPDTAAGAIGILAPRSVAVIGPQVFWLGSSDVGQNGIFVMEGSRAERISTNDIEREISMLGVPTDAVAQVWQENRHTFYAITFRAAKRTFVYDTSEKVWSMRSSYDSSAIGQEGLWRPQFATLAYNKIFFGTLDGNKLIYMDHEKWTEYDGLNIVRKRRSGVAIADFTPFYCNGIKLIINNGQVADPNLNPKVSMRWTWDGSTWSDQEIAVVGPIGRYDWETQWWTLGYGEILTVEIACSDPYDFTIVNAKVNVEPTCIF